MSDELDQLQKDSDHFEKWGEIYLVTKWSWDYQDCLKAQKKALAFVQKYPQKRIYFFCHHPPLYTLGKGLQRDMDKGTDFDPQTKLAFPLYKIFRGGGITFHYPGQWIFYPIIKLHPRRWSMDTHISFLLNLAQKALFDVYKLDCQASRKPLGVWYPRGPMAQEKVKLGSIGIGVDRHTTFHGMAINLSGEKQMNELVNGIFPCGLPATHYSCVEKVLGKNTSIADWHKHVLGLIKSMGGRDEMGNFSGLRDAGQLSIR